MYSNQLPQIIDTKIVEQPKIPLFSGESYVALPMITNTSHINMMSLLFKPNPDEPPSRLLHVGNQIKPQQYKYLLSSSYFLLLLDNLNRVELRYLQVNSGEAVIRVMGSRDVATNRWNKLIITDNASGFSTSNNHIINYNDGIDRFGSAINEIVLVLPEPIGLAKHSQDRGHGELFVAGKPNIGPNSGDNNNVSSDHGDARYSIVSQRDDDQLAADEGEITGFSGCIQNITINDRQYVLKSDLRGDILDGFDISKFELKYSCITLKQSKFTFY